MQSVVPPAQRASSRDAGSPRTFTAVQLILRAGKSPSSSWAFNALDQRRTIVVGAAADSDWQVMADGVEGHALRFTYDGQRAFARPLPGVRACQDGVLLSPLAWTEIHDRACITVGAACLTVRTRLDSRAPATSPSSNAPRASPSSRAARSASVTGFHPAVHVDRRGHATHDHALFQPRPTSPGGVVRRLVCLAVVIVAAYCGWLFWLERAA